MKKIVTALLGILLLSLATNVANADGAQPGPDLKSLRVALKMQPKLEVPALVSKAAGIGQQCGNSVSCTNSYCCMMDSWVGVCCASSSKCPTTGFSCK
jgi:hypothetical protein